MKKRLFAAVIALTTSSNIFASILPENDLNIPVDPLSSFLDEDKVKDGFYDVLNKGEKLFSNIVRDNYGTELVIYALWENGQVNASAMKGNDQWVLNMYGGMARHPLNTKDGFTLVFCHELGHLIGGYPFKGTRNVSNEGQSDYFATHACAKAMWKDETLENAQAYSKAPRSVKDLCANTWSDSNAQQICARSIEAGKVLAAILASLKDTETPSLKTPSTDVVGETYDSHPEAQCRLDTYVQGSLCENDDWDFTHTPGLTSSGIQLTTLDQVDQAAQVSCMRHKRDQTGLRPLCWYAPEK